MLPNLRRVLACLVVVPLGKQAPLPELGRNQRVSLVNRLGKLQRASHPLEPARLVPRYSASRLRLLLTPLQLRVPSVPPCLEMRP